MKFKEVDGDIFEYIKTNEYDVVIQGCNCFSRQYAGIANEFRIRFNSDVFPMEFDDNVFNKSDTSRYNKLGCIDYVFNKEHNITVCNCYSQFYPGKNGDYQALFLCFKKLNFFFKGKKLITPLIGGGIAGLDRDVIIRYMKSYLKDLESVTLVNYKIIEDERLTSNS